MRRTFLAIGGAGLVLVCTFFLVRESGLIEWFQVERLQTTVASYGAWAPMLFIAIYAVAPALLIPGSAITLAAGVLFGPIYGTLYTLIGATIGATIAFLLARTFSQRFVLFGESDVAQKVRAYDERIKRNGLATVLFLRFVPLFPFNALNYALGFTSVSFRDYVLGTAFGMIPGTFAYVYFGDSLATLSVPSIVGALALVIALALVGRCIMKRYDSYHGK
jgi:uncharacterized membrane protein YdjX (TVP38/TMEM64 family)